MTDPDLVTVQAERIRASGILGRSGLTQKLFDYLVDCSRSGRTPREIDVAVDAFGRGEGFDVSQDAVVRVYIHKLRRKLEDFYAGPGVAEEHRIIIPRGEYRLVVAPRTDVNSDDRPAADPGRGWRRGAVALLVVSLLANVVLLGVGFLGSRTAPDALGDVRSSAVWAPVLSGDLPILIVVGDYYIFGEVDEFLSVERLVREFDINSRAELERARERDPALAERYQDLNMAYLPTASAYALRDVMPVLATASPRVRIVLASDVNAEMLKSSHIIYLGYFSALGTLGEVVFAGSRVTPGESFDELYDRATGAHYVSDVGAEQGRLKYRDYAYFSTFAGPNGNRFVIITGTRDIAVMRAAEVATRAATLGVLAPDGATDAFEALYEVYGFDRTDIDATQVLTAPLDTQAIWRAAPASR